MKEFLETHESLSWTLIIISIIVLIMGCILLAALAVYLYELMKDKQQNKNNSYNAFYFVKELESKVENMSSSLHYFEARTNNLNDEVNMLDLNTDHRLLFLSKEIESVKKQQLVLAGAITTRKPKESEDSKPEIKRGRGRPKKQ